MPIINDITGPQDVEGVIRKVLTDIGRPANPVSVEVHTSPSIGISLYPEDGTDAQTLLKHADAAIVRAIVSLAHSLRLQVIAEGVETAEQLELLRTLGCDQYQGFYCSRPMPAESFSETMQRRQAVKDARTAPVLCEA